MTIAINAASVSACNQGGDRIALDSVWLSIVVLARDLIEFLGT
jgi:hypothetical protein